MPMTNKILRFSILGLTTLPVLALAACGEGYVAVPYEGVPYTHERTAGRGVAYVRASMLPPRPANTTTVVEETKTVVEPAQVEQTPPPPVTAGDKLFDNKQGK